MIEISNTNKVIKSLPNLSTLIQKNSDNTLLSITLKIPLKQSSFTFESLVKLLPKNLIPKDQTKYLVVTNLTFESFDANIITNIKLRWEKYEILNPNPIHESAITIPMTCWLLPNDLIFCYRSFQFVFKEQPFPDFVNCTVQFTKLSSKWFEFFIENGGICSIKDNYYVSRDGTTSKLYPHPLVFTSLVKKTIYISPIDDEFKILTRIWSRNQEDLDLIHTLPGFISECKENNDTWFERNVGDVLPFKKYYFINQNISYIFKNSKVVAYYKTNKCNYDPSEQLKTQYEEKLNELIMKFSEMIQEGKSDLIDTFNIKEDLETIKLSFVDNYKEEYQQYIKSKQLDLVENSNKEMNNNNNKVIEKVEVSEMALFTAPAQRYVTIFYSDKTVDIDTLSEPEIISMYGHLMDQATKKHFRLI